MLKQRILFGNLCNPNRPTLHLTTPYQHTVSLKCNTIYVITARTRNTFSHVYFKFRHTKFEIIHPGFMAMDNILRTSVGILKCYASGFSCLIIEGPNNDLPTKITSNWPWI